MPLSFRTPLAKLFFGAVPVLVLAGTWLVAKTAVDRLLYHDAVLTGRSWTAYLVENIKDLDDIAKGAKPSADSQAFFDRAQKAGQVFRCVIYDPAGHVRLVVDSLEKSADGRDEAKPKDAEERDAGAKKPDDDDDEDLAEHNPAAARAIALGQPLINAEEGEEPGRPEFFSEAYLPAIANGKTIAIVETYIDQTEKRNEFRRTSALMSGALLALIAIAFGAPGLAWLKRSNEKRRAEAHIRFLVDHDSLTGLINRNKLVDETSAALSELERTPERLALHHIDIDHFKDINDTLGHGAGDALLCGVARRLAKLASDHDRVARVGGDEFVLLQGRPASDGAIAATAAEIRRQLSSTYEVNGQTVNVSVSVGVAIAPVHGDTVVRLMKSAELALYDSKIAGRDGVSIFSNEMDEELAERLRLERAIRDALASDGFELYYQPVVEMPKSRLCGFEALLRMRDATGAIVSPALFIPLAEQMGLIDKIGEWVLREASRTAQAWPANLKVAVNLSPAQFARGELAARVERILAETGLAADRLELEITEGLLLSNSVDVLAELRKLKALGVSIVMDDFGTGHSSLSYLWRFPFDKIKIDRAFMLALEAEDRANAETIVKTIIDLGRSLNVTVTVEGVETVRQVDFVKAARCDQIQGYYFGRPMPQLDLAAYIATACLAELAAANEAAAPNRAPSDARPGLVGA
jgi:diguanylate cyclase (GGDEF)-like protein